MFSPNILYLLLNTGRLLKKLRTDKPDSVTARGGSCHLSGPVVTNGVYLPTPPGFPKKTARARPTAEADQDIRGISTHKVYPRTVLLQRGVRSYRTFSPLPRRVGAVSLSVTLSVSPYGLPIR
jgi:hypothetical protein